LFVCALGVRVSPDTLLPTHMLRHAHNILQTQSTQTHPCSLRINVGNVYFEQGRFPAAIKSYRMALDALPATAGPSRARLLRNIGLAFVRMGQYADAGAAFEAGLAAQGDHQVFCFLDAMGWVGAGGGGWVLRLID
jgi:tetratricopeptide (TPR) repeat protein